MDESESISLVGFDHVKHQQLLAVAKSPSKMLKLNKCDLQLNKFSKKPEIMVKRHTIVSESSRELNIPDTDTIGSKSISISDLTSIKEGDKVNVRVKVIDIREAKKVGKNLTKQEVIIADKTGNTILTLWESDIDTLTIAESYHVTKLNVRIFCGSYTLSFPKIGNNQH